MVEFVVTVIMFLLFVMSSTALGIILYDFFKDKK